MWLVLFQSHFEIFWDMWQMKSSLGIKSSFKFKKKRSWKHSWIILEPLVCFSAFHWYYFYNNNKIAVVNFVVYNTTKTVYEFTHLWLNFICVSKHGHQHLKSWSLWKVSAGGRAWSETCCIIVYSRQSTTPPDLEKVKVICWCTI